MRVRPVAMPGAERYADAAADIHGSSVNRYRPRYRADEPLSGLAAPPAKAVI
jgi:hypothetical protein